MWIDLLGWKNVRYIEARGRFWDWWCRVMSRGRQRSLENGDMWYERIWSISIDMSGYNLHCCLNLLGIQLFRNETKQSRLCLGCWVWVFWTSFKENDGPNLWNVDLFKWFKWFNNGKKTEPHHKESSFQQVANCSYTSEVWQWVYPWKAMMGVKLPGSIPPSGKAIKAPKLYFISIHNWLFRKP